MPTQSCSSVQPTVSSRMLKLARSGTVRGEKRYISESLADPVKAGQQGSRGQRWHHRQTCILQMR